MKRRRGKKSYGVMIALLGTDGSGKTTIINNLPTYLQNNEFEVDMKYFHWRPGFIMKGDPSQIGRKVDNPHGKPQHGKIKSFIKFMIINFDYMLGYLFVVKPELNNGKLVVFDRYYYDYYLDKVRYRLNISNHVLNFFQFMVPKPDMTFLLMGTPEVLYERKKEVSIHEISKQNEKMIRYEKYMEPAIFVDVDNPIEIVVSEIGKFVIEKGKK